MDTSIGTVIAEKIKDFAEEGIPEVFDRDLSLGRIQPPARGNLVNVIVGVRRCGKTYRLYQEMHRIVAEGYPQDSIQRAYKDGRSQSCPGEADPGDRIKGEAAERIAGQAG